MLKIVAVLFLTIPFISAVALDPVPPPCEINGCTATFQTTGAPPGYDVVVTSTAHTGKCHCLGYPLECEQKTACNSTFSWSITAAVGDAVYWDSPGGSACGDGGTFVPPLNPPDPPLVLTGTVKVTGDCPSTKSIGGPLDAETIQYKNGGASCGLPTPACDGNIQISVMCRSCNYDCW
jgi:hypothetical protein